MPLTPTDLKDTVLLLIDYQQAFDSAPWPSRWNDHVDANALGLLSAWRKAGLPVIHVRHDSAEPNSTLRPDQAGNAFRPGFGPQGNETLLTKSVNSAFIGTDLDLRLRRMGIKKVVVAGISTDMCVSTTIRTGANMGWPMVLVEDACDCFDLPDGKGGTLAARDIHRAHVATLGFEFCTVTRVAEVRAALSR